MFEQHSALEHRACKMVEFLDCEMPDFISMLLGCWHDKEKKGPFYETLCICWSAWRL